MTRKLHFKNTKICKECGKEFIPKSGTQKYCTGPHITTCEFCGKDISYTCSPREKPRFCSKACRESWKRQNSLKKYGVENVSQLSSVRKKISERNKSDEVIKKRESTCLERYGVTNVSKSKDVKAKLSDIMTSDEFKQKRDSTCLERYGYVHPMSNPNIIEKRKKTYVNRYGRNGRLYNSEDYAKIMTDSSKSEEYVLFKSNPSNYIKSHYTNPPTAFQLSQDLGVTTSPIYDVLSENKCSDLISHTISRIEQEVRDFILSICPDIRMIMHCRDKIYPYELDIYLPDYDLAIECNPAATHNSSIAWIGNTVTSYRYHQMKSDLCKNKNIFLFHIFGYEWNLKNDIIKSMIKNLLHKNDVSFGARNTYVSEIDYKECKEFLDCNHRQGNTVSSVRLGLRMKSDDSLMSVMTFGHMRSTMGKLRNSSKSEWELSRFCTKKYVNISGGASKLLKYFINNYSPGTIVSFSDDAHTKGTLYKQLGFTYESRTLPNYFWTDIYDTKFFSRVSCQKRYLKKLLHDDSIDLSKTEREIMEQHGYVRTYDSGVRKWILNLDGI